MQNRLKINFLQFYITCLIGFCSIPVSTAQGDAWQGHLQININLGNPITNIGVTAIGEYKGVEGAEFSAGYGVTYYLKNYGIPGKHFEQNLFGSAHYLWGNRDEEDQFKNYIKHLDSRQSEQSVGYTFELFVNNMGTTQRFGSINYRNLDFTLQFGNDLFGHFYLWDEYRTGSIGMGYIDKENYYSMKILFWTGTSHCGKEKKHREDTKGEYPSRWGYRDITDCNGGKYSHGILSFGLIRDAGYGQNIGAHIGIDAEQIRNSIQNKIFHDMYFIPSFMENPKNLSLPMKMSNGEDFLYLEGQKVRPARFVYQISLNPSLMY